MSDELEVLLADGVIDEILGRLKSGKEANISLVRRGDAVIAAKVYKDRATRSFKNNSGYKEGRKVRNTRTQRAMDSGGSFGRDAAEQAWKSAEADALYKLVGSGVRVPEPLMFYEGVLLMDVVCDAEGRPAPRLIDVAIERDAALGIYADLVAQLIAMLCCDLIHGDLSPYNILAAAEGPTIIDFPQVISAVHNSRAEFYFLRDFDNVVRFLAGFDPSLSVHTADGRAIWRAYVSRELTPQFVPPPPPPPRATRGPDRRSRPDQGGRPRGDQQGRPRNNQGRPGDDRASQRSDSRPQQSNGPRPQQNNGPRPQSNDDRRPQQQGDSRQQQNNGGGARPQWNDDRRPQQQGDSRPQQNNGGGPRPQWNNDRRPQQQGDSRPQQNSNSRDPQVGGARPQQNSDSRDPQAGGARPQQNSDSRDPQVGGPRPEQNGRRRRRRNNGPRPEQNSGAPVQQNSGPRPQQNSGPRPQQNSGARPQQNSDPRPGPRPQQSNDPRPRQFSSAPRSSAAPDPSGGHRRRPKRRW